MPVFQNHFRASQAILTRLQVPLRIPAVQRGQYRIGEERIKTRLVYNNCSRWPDLTGWPEVSASWAVGPRTRERPSRNLSKMPDQLMRGGGVANVPPSSRSHNGLISRRYTIADLVLQARIGCTISMIQIIPDKDGCVRSRSKGQLHSQRICLLPMSFTRACSLIPRPRGFSK